MPVNSVLLKVLVRYLEERLKRLNCPRKITQFPLVWHTPAFLRILFRQSPQYPTASVRAFVVVFVCGTHLWQDIAGSLTDVSWRFDSSRVASPTMMGKYGAPWWVKRISNNNACLADVRWQVYHLSASQTACTSPMNHCGPTAVGRWSQCKRQWAVNQWDGWSRTVKWWAKY